MYLLAWDKFDSEKKSTINNYAGMAGVNRQHSEQRRLNGHSSYIRCFIHSSNKHLLRILCGVLKAFDFPRN